MWQSRTDREIVIAGALQDCAWSLERCSAGCWVCCAFTSPCAAHQVTVEMKDERWLDFDAPTHSDTPLERVWQSLRLNGRLPGASKIALARNNRSARVKAEIPLDDQIDVTTRIREACAGFDVALNSLGGSKFECIGDMPSAVVGEDKPSNLLQLCSETGWRFSERSGLLLLELDSGDSLRQAILQNEANGSVRVSVGLVSCGSWPVQNRYALGALLLTAAGVVRFARPVAEQSDGQVTVGFEIKFATAPSPVELGHALASLSVACQLCSRETAAMQDEVIANQYLKIRGWCS